MVASSSTGGARHGIGWRRATVVLAAGVALAAAACGSSGGSSDDAKATTTAGQATTTTTTTTAGSTTTTTAASAAGVGASFYEDSFTDASKGWPQGDTADQTETLKSDQTPPLYAITVKKPDSSTHLHPEFRGISQSQLRDYAVTATIQTTLQVSSKDDFGVTCRDLHDARYELTVTKPTSAGDDGTWSILKYDGTKYQSKANGTWVPEGSTFEITGICSGGHDGEPAHLVLMVGGEKLGEATDADSPLEEGYGGVFVDSHQGNTTVNLLGFQASTVTGS